MTQALQIIGWVFFCVCCGAMTFFAVNAWFRLRDLRRRIDSVHGFQRMMFVMLIDGNIRDNKEQVDRMEEQLHRLIEDDRFEEAERMKHIIEQRKQYIAEQLAYVHTEFSNEAEVKIYNPISNGKEDEA